MVVVVIVVVLIAIGWYLNKRDEDARKANQARMEQARIKREREREEERKRVQAQIEQRDAEFKKEEEERDSKYKPTDSSDERKRLWEFNDRIIKIIKEPNEIDYNDFRNDFALFLKSYSKYLKERDANCDVLFKMRQMPFPLNVFVGISHRHKFSIPVVQNVALIDLFCNYKKIVFFDIETTGLEFGKDTIIEFAYKVVDGIKEKFELLSEDNGYEYLDINEVKKESFLINIPDYVEYKKEVQDLTGITQDQLRSHGISRKEAYDRILEVFSDCENTLFVAYNASFDLSFIYYFLGNNGDILNKINVYDPYVDLKRVTFWYNNYGESVSLDSHKLKDWVKRMQLSGVKNSHRALDDVEALIQVTKTYLQDSYYGYSLNKVITQKNCSIRLKQLEYID